MYLGVVIFLVLVFICILFIKRVQDKFLPRPRESHGLIAVAFLFVFHINFCYNRKDMSNTDIYLSDEFIKFSAAMAKIKAEKETKTKEFETVQEEFRKVFEAHKVELKKLTEDATTLKNEWESFAEKKK